MIHILLLAAISAPPSAAEMRASIAARLAILDRMVLNVRCELYTCDSGADPLVETNWQSTPVYFDSALLVARPHVRVSSLTNDPAQARERMDYAIVNGDFVARRVDPGPDGRTWYTALSNTSQAGCLKAHPLLQVYDLHVHDAPGSLVNSLRLFDEFGMVPAGETARGSLYQATLALSTEADLEVTYEIDCHGNVLSCLTRGVFRNGLRPFERRMEVLDWLQIGEVMLPSRTVVTIYNPEAIDRYTVHYFELTGLEFDSNLTAEQLRIPIEHTSSRIKTVGQDGRVVVITYDHAGQASDPVEWFVTPAPAAGDQARAASERWLAAACAAGVAATLCLAFVRRRRKL